MKSRKRKTVKATAAATVKAEPMKAEAKVTLGPGLQTRAGIVVHMTDDGYYLGRPAAEGEACPSGHTEHSGKGWRAFLPDDQGPVTRAVLKAML